MDNDHKLKMLLYTNHAAYVTGLPSGVAEAIELTLASQCCERVALPHYACAG